ncbi:MAG TPA: MFS transporter [Gryllotalpicola sp.]
MSRPVANPGPSERAAVQASDRVATRVTLASLVGTSLESYDFYVFSYFSALFSAAVFFPEQNHAVGTLAAFLTLATSYVVRPIGAIIFGHLGDRLGRKQTLIWTISIMGVSTALIGVLPSYAQIGIWAPVLLVALRVVQGLSLGGEWGGSILVGVEHSTARRRGFYASIPQLGSPIGTIIVGSLFLLLSSTMSPAVLGAWGWRLPFLFALPLLAVSLYLRLGITETPVFSSLARARRVNRLPVLDVFRRQPVMLLIAVGAAMLGIGSYSLMNTYTTSYGTSVLGFSPQALFIATIIGSLVEVVAIPLFGLWADRIGSAVIVAIGAAATLAIAFPMYALLPRATFAILAGTMVVGGLLPTLAWSGLGGLMADAFDRSIRYSALSLAYAIAAALSGFIPLLTQALANATHNAWWHPAVMLGALSVITLGSALLAARVARRRAEDRSDEALVLAAESPAEQLAA